MESRLEQIKVHKIQSQGMACLRSEGFRARKKRRNPVRLLQDENKNKSKKKREKEPDTKILREVFLRYDKGRRCALRRGWVGFTILFVFFSLCGTFASAVWNFRQRPLHIGVRQKDLFRDESCDCGALGHRDVTCPLAVTC